MRIEILARNVSLPHDMRMHIERRLGFALNTCQQHVTRILVRLSDTNGPRGGNDKRCHLEVTLPSGAVVVVHTAADFYVAISRAASRAGRAVMRRLGRRRDVSRAYTPADRALCETIA